MSHPNIIQADGVIECFDSISELKRHGSWECHSMLVSAPRVQAVESWSLLFPPSIKKCSGSLLLIINHLSLEQSWGLKLVGYSRWVWRAGRWFHYIATKESYEVLEKQESNQWHELGCLQKLTGSSSKAKPQVV